MGKKQISIHGAQQKEKRVWRLEFHCLLHLTAFRVLRACQVRGTVPNVRNSELFLALLFLHCQHNTPFNFVWIF